MDHNNKNDKKGFASVTYIFATNENSAMEQIPSLETRSDIWKILWCICASLTCIPYGLSLGWPSPTYPTLFNESAPISIGGDQSAMIAGFLMLGNTVGTPFSATKLFRAKGGLLIGNILMILGWILMWQARDIFWLLGSRFTVGLGHGFAMGQLKIYISELCYERLKITITKSIHLYIYVGLIIMFSYGPFLSFRYSSIIAIGISLGVFIIIIILPSSPRDKKFRKTVNLCCYKSQVYTNDEFNNITQSLPNDREDLNLIKLFKNKELRNRFFVFSILVFCQQFTGIPATLIYSQILFNNFQVPYLINNCFSPYLSDGCQAPHIKYFAIMYAILFFFANIFGTFYSPKYNKKLVLLISSFLVSITIFLQICILHFDINRQFYIYSSTILIYLYMIVHTLGLGNIPITLISDWFPASYRTVVTHFFIMFHSILALIITKIFQTILFRFSVVEPFYLFFSISLICFLHVTFFVSKIEETSKQVKIENNTENKNKLDL